MFGRNTKLSMAQTAMIVSALDRATALPPKSSGPRIMPHHANRPPVSRIYDAAKYDRHTEGWWGDYGNSSSNIIGELQIVRNRSREMAKNDPYLRKIRRQRRNNIIGADGFRLVMDVADWGMIKGKDGQKHWGKTSDQMANGIITRAWRRWSENPEWCDAKGRKTLTRILDVSDSDYVFEGESITVMVPGPQDNDNPFNFSLRRVRPDSLAIRYCATLPNGNEVYNGVEVDPKWGRCKGYWFYSQMQPTGLWSGPMFRVDASLVCHRYDEDYEDQHRGFPLIACVLRTVKLLHQYNEAEVIKARAQAYSVGTWSADPATISMAGPEALGDPQSEDWRTQFQQDIEPGEARIAPFGYQYHEPPPTAPNPVMPLFNAALLRQISSGGGTLYHHLGQDYASINWSAGRLAEHEQREEYLAEQAQVRDTILRPIFRRPQGWLAMAMLSQAIPLPYGKIEKFRTSDSWCGKRWPLADPRNELPYRETAVRRGWASDSDFAAEDARGTFAENVERTREEDLIAAGTAVADRNAPRAGAAAPQPKDDTDPDEE